MANITPSTLLEYSRSAKYCPGKQLLKGLEHFGADPPLDSPRTLTFFGRAGVGRFCPGLCLGNHPPFKDHAHFGPLIRIDNDHFSEDDLAIPVKPTAETHQLDDVDMLKLNERFTTWDTAALHKIPHGAWLSLGGKSGGWCITTNYSKEQQASLGQQAFLVARPAGDGDWTRVTQLQPKPGTYASVCVELSSELWNSAAIATSDTLQLGVEILHLPAAGYEWDLCIENAFLLPLEEAIVSTQDQIHVNPAVINPGALNSSYRD